MKKSIKDFMIIVRRMVFIFMDMIFLPLALILVTLIQSAVLDIGYNYYFLYIALIYSITYFIMVVAFRIYRYVWVYARVVDYFYLIIILALADIFTYMISAMIISDPNLDLEIMFVYVFFVSVFIVLLPKFLRVIIYEEKKKEANQKESPAKAKRTMIIGGGWTGNAIIKELKNNPAIYDPICILDDDIRKKGMYIQEVPVVGNTNQVEKKVIEFNIDAIILAIPSCPESDRIRILEQCVKTNKETRVLPYTHEIEKEASIVSQIKEVNIEDLLGRKAQVFDDQEVRDYVANKVCLVSGGGGSIGSEICRQIAKYHPKQIIIVDIYENNAYEIQQELKGLYNGELNLAVEITSVTDYSKCKIIFQRYEPQIIFHAAAHKHVPLMEQVPEQAVKNNIGGTLVLCRLAAEFHSERFVLISTDKAVNPTNVMGATKRCCEMITRCFGQHEGVSTKFCAVRFGNVLGSNGSVIPLFKKQIANGGPVTVTDKEITRFFMTIPEAVSLVLKTGTMAENGEIFILDMGKPVKILDLAENLIRLSGFEPYKDIKIEFTGLRPGEKLYEELLLSEEDSKTAQDKIFITKQPTIDECMIMSAVENLLKAAQANDVELVLSLLKEIVPTFHHRTNQHD